MINKRNFPVEFIIMEKDYLQFYFISISIPKEGSDHGELANFIRNFTSVVQELIKDTLFTVDVRSFELLARYRMNQVILSLSIALAEVIFVLMTHIFHEEIVKSIPSNTPVSSTLLGVYWHTVAPSPVSIVLLYDAPLSPSIHGYITSLYVPSAFAHDVENISRAIKLRDHEALEYHVQSISTARILSPSSLSPVCLCRRSGVSIREEVF